MLVCERWRKVDEATRGLCKKEAVEDDQVRMSEKAGESSTLVREQNLEKG